MQNKKYKFSVVIPIYNTESYLKEAIESVINQTINFKKNIQLILVNDGSKDNSKAICLNYKDKYPENIVYVEQEHIGVSRARNNGINYIEGEYVNFLDSDDKWDKHAFKKIYTFFKNNKDIEIVSGRMKFFEAREDYHLLDYKYDRTKVIDILKNYDFIQLHITSSFIKSELAKQFRFNENLKYGEDANYINEIILQKRYYGVVKEALHFYRKRFAGSSAVQNKEKSLDWYTKTVEGFYKNIVKISQKKYKNTIKYVQTILMYDIKYRLRKEIPNFLNEDTKNTYIKNISILLNEVEDKIIVETRNMTSEYKIYALSLKYNKDIKKEIKYKDGNLYFNEELVNRIKNNNSIFKIDILEIKDGNLSLEGRVQTVIPKEYYKIYIETKKDNLVKKEIQLKEAKKSLYTKNTIAMTEKIIYHYTYKEKIPLKNIKKLWFVMCYNNEDGDKLNIKLGKWAKLSNYKGSYYAKNEYILKNIKKSITVTKNTRKNKLKKEVKNIFMLLKIGEIGVICTRLLYFISKKFIKKDIWLISDRDDVANDNGEEFFRYVVKQQNENIKPYFVLSKKSEDYKRIKKIGKVLNINTLKHKLYFLLSSKIISSQANDYVINAFRKKEIFFNDLKEFDFIFLQHGLTKDDLSEWLKKFDKNIKIFLTGAQEEYDSIVNGDYYYTKNEVKLTGFPRFDKLKNEPQKSILILPTQRRYLVEWNTNEKVHFSYNPYFKESNFFKFYNNLINDERILEVLKEKEYKMKFSLHPLQQKQLIDFSQNDYVQIESGNINYSEEFSKNELLITDYSSVAFDFAYLKKKVIYTQFDKNEFFSGQVYEKGYFDFKTEGFGPVCYDYDKTVKEIVKTIKNDCKMEEIYLKRVENFYYKFDRNNSKRVYEEILSMEAN